MYPSAIRATSYLRDRFHRIPLITKYLHTRCNGASIGIA